MLSIEMLLVKGSSRNTRVHLIILGNFYNSTIFVEHRHAWLNPILFKLSADNLAGQICLIRS